MTRIITHHHCIDGFHSAFIAKKYLLPYFQKNQDAIVIPLNPNDVELGLFEFDKDDIVLDLPKPQKKVFFWADHHKTNKPKENLEELHQTTATHIEWRDNPSCTGLLIDYLQEQGISLLSEVLELKKILDKTDTANYTPKEYEQCFVLPNFENPTLLQQTIILSAIFQTKDANLNTEIFQGLFNLQLGSIPSQSNFFQSPFINLLAKAHFKNMEEWRTLMDDNFELDPKTKTVIQDDRKIRLKKGVPDRFYVYYKYKDSDYSVSLREKDLDKIAIGIGKNVFYNKFNPLDVGKLCKTVGKMFGKGAGGGHKDIGGCEVKKDNTDAALKYILDEIHKAQELARK